MKVRAKMRCTRINRMQDDPYNESREVHLQPVYGTDENDPNKQWSQWTPSGELRLLITNPPAYESFELWKEYYVDMTPVVEEDDQ